MRESERELSRERERRGWEDDQGWQEVKGRRKGGSRPLSTRPDIATSARRDSGDTDQYTTYFFSEFPDSFNAKAMLNIFQYYGDIVEVVIPAKRDKGGRRFGFARFDQVRDVRRFGIELDNIIIGRDKIFVNPPRFHRDTRNRRHFRQEEVGNIKGNNSMVENRFLRNDEFKTEKEVVQSLRRAFVGVVVHPGMTYRIQDEFHMQGYFGVKITPLGANLALLQDQEEGEIQALMEEARGWLDQWFKEIRPWTPGEVDNDRLVWLRVYGIPVHAWNDNFFTLISQQFGIFLNADDTTSKNLTMDVARILIRTSSLKAVDEFLNVKVNGELFQIRIIEDSYGPMRIAVPSTGTKEGRDVDGSSSEDEEGAFPVMEEEDEREEIEGGQQLLLLTKCVNTNDSLSNSFGNNSPRSYGRENIKEPSINFNEEDNLINSNSKVGENVGEGIKEVVEADDIDSSEVGFPNGPSQPLCVCSHRSNDIGGGSNKNTVKEKKAQKPTSNSNKDSGVRGTEKQGGGVLKEKKAQKPTSADPKGGNGGTKEGNQKSKLGSKEGSKIPMSKINSSIPSKRTQNSQDNHQARVVGAPSVSSLQRTSSSKPANSDSSSRASTSMVGCTRNPVKNSKSMKARENSVSSAGSILCCSSLKSSDIRNCNNNFWNKHEAEVNGKLWDGVKELGVQGDDLDEVFVERLRWGSCAKRRRLSKLLASGTFDLCLLQETKRDNFDDLMIQKLWGHKDVEWVAKESIGLSGGLLIMWNAGLFNLKFSFTGDNFLGLCVECKEGILFIINIYSPCSLSGKRKLWSDLLEFKQNNEQGEWCLGGDFNVVLKTGERKGSSALCRQNERLEFCQFVEAMELCDVPVAGKKFSWFSADGTSMSRLDRFLLSEKFIDSEKVTGQWIGSRDISDHCPIWLLCSNLNWGPKPFKVNNCWLEHPEFKPFVEKTWNKLNVEGKKAFVIKEKLKRLKEELRRWNRDVFGILDLNIENIVRELNEAEGLLAIDGANSVTCDVSAINKKFWDQLHFKESLIKQKSRLKWVREGDSNSRFFHASIKSRRRRNQLSILRRGEEWIQGVDNIKSEVKNYFVTNFTEDWHNRPFVHGINFNVLSAKDNDFLLQPFSEEDVREVLWSCDGNKSPGPDGFNFNFLKECWSILKSDVIDFLNEFHHSAVLPKGITASFLALIPKKDHPQQLSDYRPICLIGILYKLLSKVLAARLKKVMGKLISTCQSAFLPGRQILDGVVALNEIIDLAKRRKDRCLLFKVDFERAYDTISWNYLESMMLKMGFAEKWLGWMRACIFNSSMSVLINGSPTEDFTVGKGLRQGDPLSPFLFLLAAEGLTGLVKQAVDTGKFVGFKVNDSLRFQILQFADDTILLGDCSWDNVRTMKSILRGFELVSGLKVNFVKSKLYGINVDANFLAAAASFLDCSFDSIPFKFLGIPVGANPRRRETWKPIVESLAKRLSSWNGRNLLIGGRVTLINSVLSSLPLYFFSFYKAPRCIINQLVRLQRNFLWGGGTEVKKICWVKWTQVCLPKNKGGLGVKDLEMFNLALLCKWKWRCINDKDALWYDLLQHRYGPLSLKLLCWEAVGTGSKDSIWWRDVAAVGGMSEDCWFPTHVSSVLGNGNSISFWKEKWYGVVPLRDLFPMLYEKEMHKDRVVSNVILPGNTLLNWNNDWLRSLSLAELAEKADLEQLLVGVMLYSDSTDHWRWIPENSGLFSVKSVYTFLQSRQQLNSLDSNLLYALHKLWKNDIPSKMWRIVTIYFSAVTKFKNYGDSKIQERYEGEASDLVSYNLVPMAYAK
ncbi:hypothetical protein TSUD_282880 [Trifolium subterraneum]|uniref:Reverse transcriptase domain-containing protein n=1 Tax=Trifolium subterraneum TaxID=3900 RepID=A0A2Z6NYK5_TRISU|nr:hypothetical protein TSUD_282880 [Trifolium subterraneum]